MARVYKGEEGMNARGASVLELEEEICETKKIWEGMRKKEVNGGVKKLGKYWKKRRNVS